MILFLDLKIVQGRLKSSVQIIIIKSTILLAHLLYEAQNS
jgi:hypothetical protein